MISIVTPFSGATADLLPDYDAATQGAECIIIDNASDAATRDALLTLPPERGRIIGNDRNLGFAAANNQGYAAATGEIVVFLNSDIAAPPGWLDLVADDVRDGALYGPSMAQQFVAGRWLPYLEGWCIAATRATWEQLCNTSAIDRHAGPWDAAAYPGPYWEDNDLCFRAMQAGISLIQTTWPIQHKGGRTAGALANHAASIETNRATFARRVMAGLRDREPVTPTYARYLRECATQSDIQHHLPLLYSLAHGTVVELGTRSGVSTAALLAGVEQRGGHVWSIDIDDCSALYAGHPQWTFIQGDSRSPALPAQTGAVDCLLIDTEHQYEIAQAELALWGPHMAPGGHILMHDPETFPGVRRAATEYARAHGYPLTIVLPNNGMAVIECAAGVSPEGAAWAMEVAHA